MAIGALNVALRVFIRTFLFLIRPRKFLGFMLIIFGSQLGIFPLSIKIFQGNSLNCSQKLHHLGLSSVIRAVRLGPFSTEGHRLGPFWTFRPCERDEVGSFSLKACFARSLLACPPGPRLAQFFALFYCPAMSRWLHLPRVVAQCQAGLLDWRARQLRALCDPCACCSHGHDERPLVFWFAIPSSKSQSCWPGLWLITRGFSNHFCDTRESPFI